MSRAEQAAWGAGVLGLLGAALGWVLEPAVFPHAWLAATVAWSGWPLGSIALLLIHALTGGRWGDALAPALRTGITTLPLLLPLLLPIVLTLPQLYPWAQPDAHLSNRFYLNVPFFAGRGVLYLVVWFGLGALALRGRALDRIAPPGLILLALTMTFAAIDLTMSLDPRFSSSIYGMLAGSGVVLLALSLAMAVAGATAEPAALPDLGKLLLALVVLWTYLDFMQLLIVWQSDLVSEAPWYRVRMHGAWGVAMAVIAAGHFALPFGILLFPRMQRDRRVLVGVASLLVAMEVLRTWWTVLPAVPRGVGWIDLACVLGIGGMAAGIALRMQGRMGPETARGQHV